MVDCGEAGAVSELRDYRDLAVWQNSMALAKQVYQLCARLPREETFGLTSQIRRAAVSIAANIAEGAERNGTREFIHFLGTARGSAAELETLLLLASELTLVPAQAVPALQQELTKIRKMLSALVRSLRAKT
jgi:four helix bundle protein